MNITDLGITREQLLELVVTDTLKRVETSIKVQVK